MEIGLTAQLRRLCCISMRAERAFAVPDHDSRAVPCRAVPCRAVPDHSFPRQDRLSLTCRLSVPGSSIGSISECIAAAEPNSSSDQVGGSVHRHPCARSRMGMGRVICLCFLRQPTCSQNMLAQVGDQWQDIFCREDLSRLWRFTRRSRRSKDSCSTYSPRSAASSCRSAWITSTTFTIVDLDRGLVSCRALPLPGFLGFWGIWCFTIRNFDDSR